MNKLYKIIGLIGIVIACIAGYYFFKPQSSDSGFAVHDFNFEKDADFIKDLFAKGDNRYWLLNESINQSYSVDFLLRYKTSNQHSKNYDLIIKVVTVDGKFVGFLAYLPLSKLVWKLLFLAVDQDFRRKGMAKKMLNYAVQDMVHRGAIKIEIDTRVNNFRAQNLYLGYGCKITGSDQRFVHFAWHK
jgi:ribosomal protein S18 acetylase RimI-like enzyme